jgi:hypothetical protein
MLKKDDRVILHNRGKKEFGTILRTWRRKEVQYFNIKTERGIELEGITTDSSYPCFINQQLSIKLNQEKLVEYGKN